MWCWSSEYVEMHLHSPIYFYGMVLSLVQGPLELRSQDVVVSMVMRLWAG
jgi:hypothetical protein